MTRRLTTLLATILTTASLAFADESTVSLEGKWNTTGTLPDGGTNDSTFTVSKDGDKYTVEVVTSDGEDRTMDSVTVEGKTVTMEMAVEGNGQTGVLRVKADQTEEGKLNGKWYLLDSSDTVRAEEDWKAVREDPPVDIVGDWDAKATTGDGQEMESEVVFAKKDDKLSGSSKSDRGETKFDSVKVDGKKVNVELTLEMNGTELDTEIVVEAKTKDHLEGKWIISDDTGQEAATGPWEAKRKASFDLVGTWEVVADTDNGETEHNAVFTKKEDAYQGSANSDEGEADYTTVKVEGVEVHLALPFGEGIVKVTAKADGADKLSGTWVYLDSSDTEVATDKWNATRKKD